MKCPGVIAVLALTGCQAVPAAPPKAESPRSLGTLAARGIAVVTDGETGCEYLYATGAYITPRYEAGGRNSSGADLTRVRGCK